MASRTLLILLLVFISCELNAQSLTLKSTSIHVGDIYTPRPNINFDLNKSTIRPESMPLMDSIVGFLLKNNGITVEVATHLDTRFSDHLSMRLDQNRSQSVCDYLIAQGVNAERLIPKGYGKEEPLISVDEISTLATVQEQEKAHQLNRRTEFKIVSIDENVASISSAYLDFLNPFPDFAETIPLNSEIEVLEMSWPSDDRLCDQYNESQGDMLYRIYRTKGTHRIVAVSEGGAYCQGDSDYAYFFLFDEEGYAIYSHEGGNPYGTEVVTIYSNGSPALRVKYPPYGDTTGRQVEKLTSANVVTTQQFINKIEQYRATIDARIRGLISIDSQTLDLTTQEERLNTIEQLEQSIIRPSFEKRRLIFRKPTYTDKDKYGETARVTGRDVPIFTGPTPSSRSIGALQYYDVYLEVIDVMISESGTYSWYKIRHFNRATGHEIIGWVEGKHIIGDVLPIRH